MSKKQIKKNPLLLTEEDIANRDSKRRARIHEAKNWKRGTRNKKKKRVIWSEGPYEVSLHKPGEEAFLKGNRRNRYDMLPVVTKNGVAMDNATFGIIFGELIDSKPKRKVGSLLAALLVRSAFLADHRKTRQGWRYLPNPITVRRLSKKLPLL